MNKNLTCRLAFFAIALMLVAMSSAPTARADTWVNTGYLENAVHVYSLCYANDGAIYAGTASGDDSWNSVGVVFKTTDGGNTWTPTASLGGMGVVGNIETIIQTTGGSIDNNIFIGTAWEGKIFKTSNGGASWTEVVDLAGVIEVDVLIQAANGDLYAGTHYSSPDEARIYRSTDYGATWNVVAAPSIDGDLSGTTVIESMIQASTGYFYATGLPGHVWRSDNGDTWVKVADKSILGGAYKNYSLLETCNGYIYVATRSPGGVWRSTDNGNTWTQVADSTELGGSVTRCDGLCQASNGTIYVGTDTGKIYRSTDGDNWVFETSLAGASRVNAIIEAAPGHMYAGTSYSGRVFTVTTSVPFALELRAGWNMVSFPVMSDNADPDSVFPGYYVMYRWNAEDQKYVQCGGSGFEPDEPIASGVGYWVNVLADENVVVSGTPVDNLTLQLKAGWNLIGSPLGGASIADPDDTPDGSVLPFAYTWDAENKKYVSTQQLVAGKGYWVNALNDCVLRLPGGG